MSWERVYTVHDYYDGPRLGAADVLGKPHVYDSTFSDIGGLDDVFLASPISQALLELAIENFNIFLRSDDARRRGDVVPADCAVLPCNRERSDELRRLIGDPLRADPLNSVKLPKFVTNR